MNNNENNEVIRVVMLGQRRAGKSSVLASMLDAINKKSHETDFKFTADSNTNILMNTRKSQLENIFLAFKVGDFFSTLYGESNGLDFSPMTDAKIPYMFELGLTNRKDKKKKDHKIEFLDIRGEDIFDDVADISTTIASSSVIIIAVDSIALMEDTREDIGYGKYHDIVNATDLVRKRIVNADSRIADQLEKEKKQEAPPKLVLFIPIKCEKYYYENRMGELNSKLKKGYSRLLEYLEEMKNYTVAITPILTLGDVVFDHYETVTRADGKEIPKTFNKDNAPSKAFIGIPSSPMYKFKNEHPKLSPLYCEQPLLYLLAYVIAVNNIMKKKHPVLDFMLKHKFIAILISILAFAFGAPGIAVLLSVMLIQADNEMMDAAKKATQKLKTSGDGYEIVYNRLKFGEVNK